MFDPEMLRLAQEQMSRLRPEDVQRMQQQMMSNPDLMRMATEGMKNIKPGDLKFAAEQMKNIPPEQFADMSTRVARATPEELAAMRTQSDAHRSYEFQGAQSLKNQGNQLHNAGKYAEAAEKYLRGKAILAQFLISPKTGAKNNLMGQVSSEARNLQLTCSLNLMSCYLKTKQFSEAVAEGTAVLDGDPNNLKALYRRGQAYKELGQLKLAVPDLKTASEISPDDETIANVYRMAKEELDAEAGKGELCTNGPLIEEVSDDEAARLTSRLKTPLDADSNVAEAIIDEQPGLRNVDAATTNMRPGPVLPSNPAFGDSLSALKQNPDMIRNMHSLMSTVSPDTIAAMSGGSMSPEMVKFATNMMKQMSPDDMERMVGLASNVHVPAAEGAPVTMTTPVTSAGPSLPTTSERSSDAPSTSMPVPEPLLSDPGAIPDMFLRSGAGTPGTNMPSMADFSPEIQEQMRKQMKDPAMKQMMASMMKSMTPETMTSMSEQLGMKMTPEQAMQAQQAMASLSPEQLDRLMIWAERAQNVVQQAKRAKNWLLGRPGLVLALVMLIFAAILHRLGYIGG